MAEHEREVSVRTCHVCGNVLEKYQRLCDRCGSIQRPIKARGVSVTREAREKPGACERCGVSVPARHRLCDPCAAAAKQATAEKKKSSQSGLAAYLRKIARSLERLMNRLFGRERAGP